MQRELTQRVILQVEALQLLARADGLPVLGAHEPVVVEADALEQLQPANVGEPPLGLAADSALGRGRDSVGVLAVPHVAVLAKVERAERRGQRADKSGAASRPEGRAAITCEATYAEVRARRRGRKFGLRVKIQGEAQGQGQGHGQGQGQ
eukprot:6611323-Prymnesium_polylepis.1